MSDDTDIELFIDGLSFPTSLTFDQEGNIYVAESGLPFGGATPGGRVWHIDPNGTRTLIAEHLRRPRSQTQKYTLTINKTNITRIPATITKKASIRADEHDSAFWIANIIPIKIPILTMTITVLTCGMRTAYII